MAFTTRRATQDDVPALRTLIHRATDELQRGFLDDEQIRASHAIMGVDTQLVEDGTYFVVEDDGVIAGCGGWSRRATAYGADHAPNRDIRLLDPATEAARVRAMYTHPAWARRGIGRRILALCEAAAAAEGFRALELTSTAAGRPLYDACGYLPVAPLEDRAGGVPIPLLRMRKDLVPPEDRRGRARALARAALDAGAPTTWFDTLYQEAEAGLAVVPWDDGAPSPELVKVLDAHPFPPGARVLDVGCGLGDNAAELARRGCTVTAFDVSPTAVAAAGKRFADPRITFCVADVLALPDAWAGAFDGVVEIYTLQVLPPPERARAAAAIARCVAPGGRLVVLARAREPSDPVGAMPWPLLRSEIEAIGGPDLVQTSLDERYDDEDPPVRRWIAQFRRALPATRT